jgi:DNA integrity scanning protein DisA with diadenylate cyclase activity/mannitol/fructose-specific phosphotransferase system IIA component (Ntr-type)
MRLDPFINRKRVVELQSTDLTGALRELLDAAAKPFRELNRDHLLKSLLQRENTMTTYLGYGVALPHVRTKMKRRYLLAIGRSTAGIRYDGIKEDENIKLIILLLADERARDYLQVLATIARLVKDQQFVERMVFAPTTDEVFHQINLGFGGIAGKPVPVQQSRVNRTILRHAERIARGTSCQGVIVFGDTCTSTAALSKPFPAIPTTLVTSDAVEANLLQERFAHIIQVKSYSTSRFAQLRSAMLVGLSRGWFRFNDRLCCVGGIADSNQFDTVVVVDVEREFQSLLSGQPDLLPTDVKPEVLERIIAVATELSAEGREGRPVGCLFVLGDTTKVERMTKPLVMNPFFGYKDEDKNILNPFMDETIKEFSSLDGAFVIRGDGVVRSAGSLIQASDTDHPLPSGLGSRHAAAAAISVATDCVSIVVSSSTGQVTLFRRGVMLPLIERKLGPR